MAKIAHATTETTERASATSTRFARVGEQNYEAARNGADRAHDKASDFGQEARAIQQRTADKTTDLGRTALDLFGEQTQHNLHAMTAMGQAIDWTGVANTQREFISGSFDRMNRFAEHYQKMMRAGMSATSFPGKR